MSKSKVAKTASKVHSQNLFILLLAATALIVGISSMYLMRTNQAQTVVTVPEKNSIQVSDQTPGSKVNITKVVLDQPGFVIVRLEVEVGNPGKVIGVSKYLADDTQNLDISLYQNITSGQKLTAEVRADNDANKRFNVLKDLDVKDSKGEQVRTFFAVK